MIIFVENVIISSDTEPFFFLLGQLECTSAKIFLMIAAMLPAALLAKTFFDQFNKQKTLISITFKN